MKQKRHNKGLPEYWSGRVHEPDERSRYWWSEQQHSGERRRIPHETVRTRQEAAIEAARVWLAIERDGWDQFLSDPSLKAYIKGAKNVFNGKQVTFKEYVSALRRIVGSITGLGILPQSTSEKDRIAWERLIDEQKLSVLSLEAIRNYIRQTGALAAGNVRLAQYLFNPAIRLRLHWRLLDPFRNVALRPDLYRKFESKIEDFKQYIDELYARWPTEDLTGKKIFCLIAYEGLERNQIDVLKWSDFELLDEGCKLFGREFRTHLYLELWNHRGPGNYVIWSTRSAPSVNARSYRLDPEFKALAKQLREMGVNEKRPLEYLKLECDAWRRRIYDPNKVPGVPFRKGLNAS